jgi:alpha/beta hydrolase fold
VISSPPLPDINSSWGEPGPLAGLPSALGKSAATLDYLYGGWILLSIDMHDTLVRELAATAGVVVLGVDCPLDRHPVGLKVAAR